MAFKELFNILENAPAMALSISKQLKAPEKNYGFGAQTTTDKS